MVDTDGDCAPTQHRSVARTAPGPAAACGPPAELVTVPSREGLEALDILRLRAGTGPVLHDRRTDTLGFVVPAGTAGRWDLPGTRCRPVPQPSGGPARWWDRPVRRAGQGRGRCPAPPVRDGGWLVAPDASALPATPPGALCAALREAGRILAALDRSCH